MSNNHIGDKYMNMSNSISQFIAVNYRDQYLTNSHYLNEDEATSSVLSTYKALGGIPGSPLDMSECIISHPVVIPFLQISGECILGRNLSDWKATLAYRGIIVQPQYLTTLDWTYWVVNQHRLELDVLKSWIDWSGQIEFTD